MTRRIPILTMLLIFTSCAVEDTTADSDVDAMVGPGSSADVHAPDTPAARASGLLTNPYDWGLVAPERDPFSPEGLIACDSESHGPEEITGVWVYSVQTETCDWLTISQQTAIPIEPGDRLRARVFHFALTAPAEATAHLGLAWSDGVFVTADEPIPSESQLVTLDYIAEHSRPAGAELFFHIDNHGSNSWHLLELRLNPVDDEP